MNNLDFQYDADDFQTDVANTARLFKRAKENVAAKAQYWSELGPKFLGGIVTVETDGTRIIGQVAGKGFWIDLVPLINQFGSYALAVVSVQNVLDESRTEVDRFLLDDRGRVVDDSGGILLSMDEDVADFRLLAAIVRRVLAVAPKG